MSTSKGAPGKSSKVTILLVALLLVGVGFASLVGGAVIAVLNQTTTDKEGYSLSAPYHIHSSAYGFMLGLSTDTDSEDTALTKWVVTSTNPGQELFVGWASINDTTNYVGGFQFDSPYPGWHWDYGPYSSAISIADTKTWGTASPNVLPSQETFWIDSAQTSGVATIHYDRTWDNATLGDRSLLIMNVDGTPNVQADLQLGTKIPMFGWMPLLLIPAGLILSIMGIAVFLLRRRSLRQAFSPEK